MKALECEHTDINKIPHLKSDDVKLWWAEDWYDGPLSGMAEYQDQEGYWYHLCDIAEDRAYIYALYKLTPEQFEYERKWYEFYKENVGDCYDFRDKGCCCRSSCSKSEEEKQEAYEQYKKEYVEPTLTKEQLIGWFR